MALDATRYDVIEADAILPKAALSGLLYSQEFFQQVRSKLAPGGISVQWAPTKRSIDTFRSVFPFVTIVHPPGSDSPVMLGSDKPIPYSRDKILKLLARPEVDVQMTSTRVDRATLTKWFEDAKPQPLNRGQGCAGKFPQH